MVFCSDYKRNIQFGGRGQTVDVTKKLMTTNWDSVGQIESFYNQGSLFRITVVLISI